VLLGLDDHDRRLLVPAEHGDARADLLHASKLHHVQPDAAARIRGSLLLAGKR